MYKTVSWCFIIAIVLLLNFISEPSWADMVQQESVQFPDLGVLSIQAHTVNDNFPKLLILDSSKKILLQIEMGSSDSSFKHGAGIEFMVHHIAGLPDPLLMVVAADPHGSDTAWEVALIGVASGKIKLLWKQPSELWSEGGFFVGNLGERRGTGIALWNFVWGNECHACPHQYSLQLFPWNKERSQFDVGPHYTNKDKYKSGTAALKELGFSFQDQRRGFKRLSEFW